MEIDMWNCSCTERVIKLELGNYGKKPVLPGAF